MPRPFAVWNEVWVITYPYDDPTYYGYTYCNERRIMVITKQRNCSQFRDTTFHEFMHAATKCEGGKREIHTTIWNLSPALEEFTRLNPKATECWR